MKKLLIATFASVMTTSAMAHDVTITSTDSVLTVQSLEFEKAEFMNKNNVVLEVKNNSQKVVKAFKTVIFCNDYFDEKLFKAQYKDASSNIAPGATATYTLNVMGTEMYGDLNRKDFSCGIEQTQVVQ